MFKVDSSSKTIKVTRGDRGKLIVRKKIDDNNYEKFETGDKLIFSIKNNFGESEVILRKEIVIEEDTESVPIVFTKEDTTIGDLISSEVEYEYDISINGDVTILGYDESGPKKFVLYPEGSDDV